MLNLQNNKNLSVIYILSTLLIAAFYFFPQLRILIRYDELAYLTVIYYVCFLAKYVKPRQIVNLMKFAIPYCLLMFVAKGFNFKYGFLHNFMTLWNLIIPSVICIGLILRNRPRELFVITWLSIIMILMTCITTLQEMSVSMNVMRELTAGTTDQDYAMKLREKGVGGFGVAYGMGALAVGLFALLKQMKPKDKWKIVILVLLLFAFYFVTQAQFTTLLIITVIGAASCYFINAQTTTKKIAVVLATIAILVLMPTILRHIISLYNDTVIGVRLSRMYDSIWGGGDVSEVSGQRSVYQLNAFYLFLESPIWGNNITGSLNGFTHLACHSTLLAVACATGIIGIWSYLKTFSMAFKNELNLIIEPSLYKSYYPIILYYFLFSIFNPIDSITEASWIIFVIIPSLYKLYVPQK